MSLCVAVYGSAISHGNEKWCAHKLERYQLFPDFVKATALLGAHAPLLVNASVSIAVNSVGNIKLLGNGEPACNYTISF